MAVFTPVSLDDLNQWITQFPLGKARSIKGIASGIENSNFFIETDTGEYVLTIFENLTFEQLPFYLYMMRHLALRDIPVPAPISNLHDQIVVSLHGKPASIVSKLEGSWQLDPQRPHCAAVGEALAKMHVAGKDFPLHQPNLRGLDWWNETTPVVLPYLSDANTHLLLAEMHFQDAFAASKAYHHCPRGPIHADLFRNNAMFVGERLSGIFDFYFAGCDAWLFDVAVTLNDWCIDLQSGEIDQGRARGFLDAYHAVRPFTEAEQVCWQAMLRAGALRFWLSRLYDFHLPRAAEMLTPHDPAHFERILRQRIEHAPPVLF